jgi:hypothetical protein
MSLFSTDQQLTAVEAHYLILDRNCIGSHYVDEPPSIESFKSAFEFH